MKKFLRVVWILFPLCGALHAQTPTDAVMMKQFESCFAVIYDQGTWDHYWEGDYLRTNGNVGTFSRKMILPMIAIGLHEKLNLIVSAPHIRTESKEGSGGYLQGASGMQDFGVSLKARVFEKSAGTAKVSLLTNVGYSTPMTDYLSDYVPYSLGFGASEWSLRGIGHFKMLNGLYATAGLAHLWRGQTRIERDYYYSNGSYYTDLMDVPDAWHFNAAAGIMLFDNSWKLEANYMSTKCTSGDDIRKYNAGQPTNKVEAGQVGFMTQYFFKNVKGLGLLAYYSKIISGRNMGQFSDLGLGVTYQFKFLNTTK